MKSNIIIGVVAHKRNEYDSKTLEVALASTKRYRTKPYGSRVAKRTEGLKQYVIEDIEEKKR